MNSVWASEWSLDLIGFMIAMIGISYVMVFPFALRRGDYLGTIIGTVAIGMSVVLAITWAYTILSMPTFRLRAATWSLGSLVMMSSFLICAFALKAAPWLNRKFSKTWVKALDFPYLLLACGGVVRLVNASPHLVDPLQNFDSVGIVLLALAIGVRLAKAVLEVFFEKRIASG